MVHWVVVVGVGADWECGGVGGGGTGSRTLFDRLIGVNQGMRVQLSVSHRPRSEHIPGIHPNSTRCMKTTGGRIYIQARGKPHCLRPSNFER